MQMRRDTPFPARTVPVPNGQKSLPKGTLSSIIKLAGMTVDEFMNLL